MPDVILLNANAERIPLADNVVHAVVTSPPHDPAPMMILDPFAGSGTTGVVARELGHHAVLLDLSYTYLNEQARSRLELDRLAEWTEGGTPAHDLGAGKKDGKGSLDDLPLFMDTDER